MSARTPSATLTSTDPVLAAFADDVGPDGPVAVEGARTRWDLGGSSTPGTRLVAAPDGIVDYQPEEMTVTVRAGTTVADLHAALAERGQRSALVDRGGTIGGALMVGENDVRALGRGLIRTAPLQVRYVSAEGRIVSSGGPTVKNVSGFDLPRLLVGSLGTLGLLAEVILRTNPIPPVSRWVSVEGAAPAQIQNAVLAPSAVLWDGDRCWVQLEGHQGDVEAETARLRANGHVEELDPEATADDGLPVELPAHRWSLTPAEALTLDQESRFDTGPFVAAVGLGLVFAGRPQPQRTLAHHVDIVARRVKENFDPTGRLNPGRDAGAK
jgi:glycolate oxidase FAD binding subunit